MSEAELRAELDNVKELRRALPRYGEKWAALCVEMGRLTAAIRKIQQSERPKCPVCGKVK